MSATSVSEFLAKLQKSRLLTDAQILSLQQQLSGSPRTVAEVSETLVKNKILTQWQASQLAKGQTGLVLNQYQLLSPVGRGGMGHVFRARDTRSNTVVAIKVMAKKLVDNETLVSRFRREIWANAKLQSPHIVRSLDAGRVGSVDFMVMEYANGQQVSRLAEQLGRIPAGLACEIARQVAIGLQHAHELQMVHRDIKPANIMLHWSKSGECVVKLMDMGLVLLTGDDPSEKTVTRAGQVMGTPDYMSPEQGWDTAQVDIRSDIYSLGCTLFRLLTGTVPFTGTNPLQVLGQRLQRDAPSIQSVCDDLPGEVAAVVSRMTARDPELRFQQPADAAEALRPYCKELTQDAFQRVPKSRSVEKLHKTGDQSADGTYREFLKEIQSSGGDRILLAASSANPSNTNTIPILEVDTSSSLPAVPDRTRSERHMKPGKLIVAATAIVSVLVAAATFLLVDRPADPEADTASVTPPATANVVEAASPTPPPTATFRKTTAGIARPGEVWSHNVSLTSANVAGKASIQLDPAAPGGMTIDRSSNTITWAVPDDQTPGTYSIDLCATCQINGQPTTIAKSTIDLIVQPTLASLTLPAFETPLRLRVNESFQMSLNVESEWDNSPDLRYEIDNQTSERLSLDGASGKLNWTPSAGDIGRHDINVIVSELERPDSARRISFSCLVLPTSIEHVLREIPPQTATAGSEFRLSLPLQQPQATRTLPGKYVISKAVDAPGDFSVDAARREVIWTIPDDVEGTVSISLKAYLELSDVPHIVNLDGIAKLTIKVVAPTEDSGPEKSMPPETQMAAAKEELQKTFGAAIRSARTAKQRYELAARLLTQCVEASPGASDAALLSMIETELAEKCRAVDLLLRIAELRGTRYGTDEVQAAASILDANRRVPLTAYQQEMVVEHCLRLADTSVAESEFGPTTTFLQTVTSLLGKRENGVTTKILSDIRSAKNIAVDLAESSGSVADTLKINELKRLISRWQFQSIYHEGSGFGFIQFSPAGQTAAISNSGRGLWTVKNNAVSIRSETAPAVVGIVENTLQPERFVMRFEVSPDSNCAQLLLGIAGTPNKDMNLVQIVLNTSDFGRIQTLRPLVRLDDPAATTTPTVSASQYNLVEVAVDKNTVVVRVNSVAVSRAEVPDLAVGRLGFAADLRRPQPRLSIRRPRRLVIPE